MMDLDSFLVSLYVTGYGTVIYASTYHGAVVETPIEYIPGYVGAVDPY